LEKLVSILGDAAYPSTHYLAMGANPDSALRFTVEIAETDPKKIKKILASEQAATTFFKSIAISEGVQSILRRLPEFLDVYLQKKYHLNEDDIAREFISADDQDSLRRIYRKLLISVIASDVSQNPIDSFEPVSEMLSQLAAAALQRAFELACIEHQQDPDLPMAIIAMGKTGGSELNYVSDVDVIFVASDEIDDNQLQIATKIANRLMRIIDSTSSEPALWEVDPNLRPEGKDGAMVRRLKSHLSYYQKWAKNWESSTLQP
jgi:Glutamine synthetase adenylyltransferase